MELWSDCVVAVQVVGGKGAEVHIEGVSPSQESWKKPLRDWFETRGYREVGPPLIQPAAQSMTAQTQVVISLALATMVALGCWALENQQPGEDHGGQRGIVGFVYISFFIAMFSAAGASS